MLLRLSAHFQHLKVIIFFIKSCLMCVMFVYIILQHNQVYDIDIINISTGLYNCVIMLLKKLLSPPNLQTFQCFYL